MSLQSSSGLYPFSFSHLIWFSLATLTGSHPLLDVALAPSVTRKNGNWGFEAGPFFVLSNDCKNNLYMKQHEHGHGIQTLWWGPLMFLIISIKHNDDSF